MNAINPEQAVDEKNLSTIWNRSFLTIFFTSMVFNMGQNMSNSMLSIYANSLGATAGTIGFVTGTFAISSILFRLISSPIMDTYNRRYIVVFAALTLSCSFWGFSMSGSIPALMGFRMLQGAGMAFGNACCLAMVAEIIPKEKYASGIGYYSLAQVIAQATGPAVGLWVVDRVGFRVAYSLTACLMMLASFLAFQIKNSYTRTKKLKITFHNIIAKEVFIPSLIMLLAIMGTSPVNSFLVIFARSIGMGARIGLYFTVTAGVMLILRPFMGRLVDRFGVVRVLIPAIFCNVIAFYIISFSTTLWGFLLAAVVSSFAQSACQPAMQTLSMKTVTNERRGAVSSTNYIGMDLGMMLGPIIAGNVAQAIGYVNMYRVQVYPFFIIMAILFFNRKTIREIEERFITKFS